VNRTGVPGPGSPVRGAALGLLAAVVIGLGVLAGAVVVGAFGPATAAGAHPLASPSVEVGPAASGRSPSGSGAPIGSAEPTAQPTAALVAAPLDGLLVTAASALRHPIAVMIDDHVDARPQSGFNAASVVWQAPAEGGIPRYMLIFQEQVPAAVGPVRSSREYFIEWAAEWRAMYVHAGGSPQALATLRVKGRGQDVWNADDFRWEGRYLWRVHNGRVAPHNVFTDGAHLRALATVLGVPDGPIAAAWTFAPDRSAESRPTGGRITVTYPYESITYRYDAATNTYRRYINGSKTPQLDAADGKVVAPKNVVILRMHFGPLNDGHPDKQRLEAANVGSGVAWISTNGRTVKGTWRKASILAPTLLFGPDGKPVTFTAGQTFIQVLPLTNALTIRDGKLPATTGMWRPGSDDLAR
jgi:Protein of unknown function (DUF3048) N-terminal domain/Protein of unknown function (DUF3048) C-terminal domain